jgi:hypothetical protein
MPSQGQNKVCTLLKKYKFFYFYNFNKSNNINSLITEYQSVYIKLTMHIHLYFFSVRFLSDLSEPGYFDVNVLSLICTNMHSFYSPTVSFSPLGRSCHFCLSMKPFCSFSFTFFATELSYQLISNDGLFVTGSCTKRTFKVN